MSVGGYVVMTLVLSGVWGGFIYLVYKTVRTRGKKPEVIGQRPVTEGEREESGPVS